MESFRGGKRERYAVANQPPDHSTIAKFQWENHAVIAATPVGILQLAQEMQLPRAGTISVDGTKIAANASQSRSVTDELGEPLRLAVAGMLVPAERATAAGEARGDGPQSELADQQALVPQMDRARRARKQRPRRHRQTERARIAAVTDPDCRRTPCRGRHRRTAGARRTNRTTSPTRAVA